MKFIVFVYGFLAGFFFEIVFRAWLTDKKIRATWNFVWSFRWFTVTMVIVTFWNCLSYLYHFLYIGMDWSAAAILQVSALAMEYFVSPWYEKHLIQRNREINLELCELPNKQKIPKMILRKYIAYTVIFSIYFACTYFLRLYVLNYFADDLGIDLTIRKVEVSTTNMIYFMLVAGWLMGSIVILRKARQLTWKGVCKYMKKFFVWIGSLFDRA